MSRLVTNNGVLIKFSTGRLARCLQCPCEASCIADGCRRFVDATAAFTYTPGALGSVYNAFEDAVNSWGGGSFTLDHQAREGLAASGLCGWWGDDSGPTPARKLLASGVTGTSSDGSFTDTFDIYVEIFTSPARAVVDLGSEPQRGSSVGGRIQTNFLSFGLVPNGWVADCCSGSGNSGNGATLSFQSNDPIEPCGLVFTLTPCEGGAQIVTEVDMTQFNDVVQIGGECYEWSLGGDRDLAVPVAVTNSGPSCDNCTAQCGACTFSENSQIIQNSDRTVCLHNNTTCTSVVRRSTFNTQGMQDFESFDGQYTVWAGAMVTAFYGDTVASDCTPDKSGGVISATDYPNYRVRYDCVNNKWQEAFDGSTWEDMPDTLWDFDCTGLTGGPVQCTPQPLSGDSESIQEWGSVQVIGNA